MQDIKVEFATNTIIVTKCFYEAATDPTTNEYAVLQNVIKENPKMTVTFRSVRKSNRSNDSKGLTYRYMRKFISIMDSANLATFESTMLYYESLYMENAAVYQCMKDWFLENYPHHKDMIVEAAPRKVFKKVA